MTIESVYYRLGKYSQAFCFPRKWGRCCV